MDKKEEEELEKLGEVQKFQFDYFKLMTTLNMAFITALIALVKGVFETPKAIFLVTPAFIFLMISLLVSLLTLVNIGNIILWMKGIPVYLKGGEEEKAEGLAKKVMDAFDSFGILQKIAIYSFGLGALVLLAFAVRNFWDLI